MADLVDEPRRLHDPAGAQIANAAGAETRARNLAPASALLIGMLVLAGFTLTVFAFYPGYMTNDAGYVYAYSRDWSFNDWQSPLMSLLWWTIDPISPGTGSMFLLVAALYWLGFGLVALTLARWALWLGIASLVLALTPSAFFMLVMIWRDILFGAVWLLAAALSFATAGCQPRIRVPAQALALALVVAGLLLRPNAIAAAPVLATYALWPERFDFKRAALLFVPGLAAGYLTIQLVYYEMLDVRREHPEHSLMVFDLGGITHYSGDNQFPVRWDAEQSKLLTSTCYNPDRWDTYWTVPPCPFVMARLTASDDVIFGTSRLRQAWTGALLAHPLAYLMHRLSFTAWFLTGWTLNLELYHASDPSFTPLAQKQAFQAVLAAHAVLGPTVLFRTGFWLVAAIMIGALAWPRRATAAGAFAVGITASAVIYVATFFLIGVAGDFRYAYWCVLASLVGAPAAIAARYQ